MTAMQWKWIATAGLLAAGAAQAQNYPTRPIRMIVPFPPAGATDVVGRTVALRLGEAFGQTVVVDNRPGASGNLGSELVAKASPDGYTLGVTTVGTHAINQSLFTRMPYDTVRDFAPVTLVVTLPNILVVNLSVPAKTVPELIALARSQPGKLAYASSGSGSSPHLCGELFKTMTGTQILHVPYKGSAAALVDLIGGHVALFFDNFPSAYPHVKSGKLRGLAVTSGKRSASAPDVPTMAEAGLPGYEATAWFGIVAPAKTPPAIVERLHAEIAKGLAGGDMKARLDAQGFDLSGLPPAGFANHIKSEIAKWAKVIKDSGAKLE